MGIFVFLYCFQVCDVHSAGRRRVLVVSSSGTMQKYLSHSQSAPQFPDRQCDVDGRRLSLQRLGKQIVYEPPKQPSPPRTEARRHFHGTFNATTQPSAARTGVRRVPHAYPENPSPIKAKAYVLHRVETI